MASNKFKRLLEEGGRRDESQLAAEAAGRLLHRRPVPEAVELPAHQGDPPEAVEATEDASPPLPADPKRKPKRKRPAKPKPDPRSEQPVTETSLPPTPQPEAIDGVPPESGRYHLHPDNVRAALRMELGRSRLAVDLMLHVYGEIRRLGTGYLDTSQQTLADAIDSRRQKIGEKLRELERSRRLITCETLRAPYNRNIPTGTRIRLTRRFSDLCAFVQGDPYGGRVSPVGVQATPYGEQGPPAGGQVSPTGEGLPPDRVQGSPSGGQGDPARVDVPPAGDGDGVPAGSGDVASAGGGRSDKKSYSNSERERVDSSSSEEEGDDDALERAAKNIVARFLALTRGEIAAQSFIAGRGDGYTTWQADLIAKLQTLPVEIQQAPREFWYEWPLLVYRQQAYQQIAYLVRRLESQGCAEFWEWKKRKGVKI